MITSLNLSNADENQNDPTITRCINFAKSWSYGCVCVTNLFAFYATVTNYMKTLNNPIGSENDAWINKLSRKAAIIVAAWGNDGSYLNRSGDIMGTLLNLHYIKINKSSEAAHPLYVKADLKPLLLKNPKCLEPKYNTIAF